MSNHTGKMKFTVVQLAKENLVIHWLINELGHIVLHRLIFFTGTWFNQVYA